MKNTIIYVDLDETLVHNTGTSSIIDSWRSTQSGNIFQFQDIYIIRRPYCIEFLKNLNDLVNGNVYILTAGETKYQTNICNACGITPCVKGIYGYQDLDIPVDANYRLLIDNDPSMSLNTVHKVMKMGFYPYGDSIDGNDATKVSNLVKKHVLPVLNFDPNTTDTELLTLMPQVKQYIEKLQAIPKASYSSRIRKYF